MKDKNTLTADKDTAAIIKREKIAFKAPDSAKKSRILPCRKYLCKV